jgi:hypothetical protein
MGIYAIQNQDACFVVVGVQWPCDATEHEPGHQRTRHAQPPHFRYVPRHRPAQ